MRKKTHLSYITLAAIFVLTSIFVGVHTTGVKDSSAHIQLSPKYSQLTFGRDRGKIYQVMKFFSDRTRKDEQEKFNPVTIQRDSGLLSSVSPRGPP